MHSIVAIDPSPRRTRRHHSKDFKAAVVAACNQPGASVAAVALANQVNANLVRRWIFEHDQSAAASTLKPVPLPTAGFLPVQVTPSIPTTEPIRIELRQGAMSITIAWPASVAHDCANWIKDLLR